MKRVTIGLLLTTMYGIASADFTILDPSIPQTGVPAQSITTPSVGVPGSMLPPGVTPNIPQKLQLAPKPNNTSLSDTMKKIAPKGWKVFSDKSLNTSVPVEYVPNTDWKQSLTYLSTRYNLVFTVDEAKKIIKLDQNPGGMRDTSLDNKNLAKNNLIPEKAPSATAPNGALQLVVKDNQKLSEAIEIFLRSGNWDLVWEAGSDIEVKKGFTIIDKELSNVLTQALSKFKLHASLHPKNNTAVVRSDATID